jgi:acylphosphatase
LRIVSSVKVRAHIFLGGRVQGVLFRSETKIKAEKHGVTGWVRNLSDRRVEVVLEGDEKSVGQLIEFCRRGPPSARVMSIHVLWENYAGEFRDFEIRFG